MNSQMLALYLNKIGLFKQPQTTVRDLKELHRAQHCTIAFENFDVIAAKPILLAPEMLLQKLVQKNRGGYCFELNALLLDAIQTLGFDARALLARVHLSKKASGRSHQVCLVTIKGEPWLVDAGFGSQTPREPLPIILNTHFKTDLHEYRFIEDQYYGIMLQNRREDEWGNLYSLDMSHVCEGDIAYANHYTSTHPDSTFTRQCCAAIRIEEGMITLVNNRIKIRTASSVQELLLDNQEVYFSSLKEMFGLELNIPYRSIEKQFE